MMEIFWTMQPSQDRKRIREYIAEQNLMAAIELDERIGYSAQPPVLSRLSGIKTLMVAGSLYTELQTVFRCVRNAH